MMPRWTLDQILALEDHDGLLDVKAVSAAASSEEARVRRDFEEVNRFVDHHGFLPGEGGNRQGSLQERMLAMRITSYRQNAQLVEQLLSADRHGIFKDLERVPKEPKSLEEILSSSDDLLEARHEDIFELKHARPKAARPDKVSERKPAKDFDRFKTLFDACVRDLVTGKRRSIKFANEQEINAGEFFILNGVMVYVAEVNDPHFRNGKRNARLRLIFENGTEGENLLRSLATELYKDPSGRRISSPDVGPLFGDETRTEERQAPESRVTGCIYVVRSLSSEPSVAKLGDNLFKIGFTTGSFEDRVRSAKDDPTFLFAPILPVRVYQAYDLNAGKFEFLLHRFFADARLNIEIPDRFGKLFRPQEWFLLRLPIIEQAIPMMLDGSITRHRYDRDKDAIVEAGART